MSNLVTAVLTGIAFPVFAAVLKRHYEEHPKQWEQVFAVLLLSVGAIAASLWLNSITDNASSGPFLVDLVVSVVGVCLILGGFIGIVVAGFMARAIYSKPE